MDTKPKRMSVKKIGIIGLAALVLVGIGVVIAVILNNSSTIQQQEAQKNQNQEQAQLEKRPITVRGVLTCQPYKEGAGTVTGSCRTSVRTDDGKYYGLKDPSRSFLRGTPQNKPIEIQGTLELVPDDVYISEGTISIEALREL